MTDDEATVPVWTLTTGDVQVPPLAGDRPMTADRLAELRGALAALADEPIATLEVHPLPDTVDTGRGIPLDAASPLAQHLSQLISARGTAATVTGEELYRMVVPAKVAARFGQGLVRPMASKSATVASTARSWARRASPRTRGSCRSEKGRSVPPSPSRLRSC